MTEQWRPVTGFEELYRVSDAGRVWSVRTARILKPTRSRTGSYEARDLRLYRDSRAHRARLSHIVLTAFVGPRPEGFEACHADGDPANNCLSNLRWDTHSANMLDAVRHGTHNQSSKTRCNKGHSYTDDNVLIQRKAGRFIRRCKTCSRERDLVRGPGRRAAWRKEKEQQAVHAA